MTFDAGRFGPEDILNQPRLPIAQPSRVGLTNDQKQQYLSSGTWDFDFFTIRGDEE